MLKDYQAKLEKEGLIYLSCKVFPGAGENKIKGFKKDNVAGKDIEVLQVKVSASAVKNQANKELLKLLAKAFNLKVSDISIISGASSRVKLLKLKK